jgi:ABC-type branched-subunit amino acid transport system permease subunit
VTLSSSRTVRWVGLSATALSIVGLPYAVELFTVINATIYASMAMLALSLALLWGFGGVLCLGQTSFFGLGGYAYAVAAINFGDSTPAVLVGILVPTIFASMVGYFLFWGRIADVYFAVITLTITLILNTVFNATAGDAYHIGKAALGGLNGMPSTPILNLPWDRSTQLSPEQIWYVAGTTLAACYLAIRGLLRTTFGRVVVSIRENEFRAELLGYDVRAYKLGLFMLCGGIAGLSGVLFANCVFVSPTMFSLFYSAQVAIWVIVGGLGTLIGAIAGSVLVQMVAAELGRLEWLDPNFILGLMLIAFVLLIPGGLLPALRRAINEILLRRKKGTNGGAKHD